MRKLEQTILSALDKFKNNQINLASDQARRMLMKEVANSIRLRVSREKSDSQD